MSGRKLRPEEKALWDKVAAKTDRLSGGSGIDMASLLPDPVQPRPLTETLGFAKSGFVPKKATLSASLSPASAPSVAMDKRAFQNLKRGKLEPEAKIDLHGMTLDRAHPALIRFILASHGKGLRLVLVITGKGKSRGSLGPIPTQIGVLKHHVPQWLGMVPLRSVVMQMAPANVRHGGDGALYVYLRRAR